MGSGIFNIVIGGVLIVLAFGFGMTLMGTQSREALAGVGAAIAVLGGVQIFRARNRK